MALVAMPLGDSDPAMQHLKHYIDLTQDSDSETPPAPKRQKSEIPETKKAQTLFSNSPRVPRQTTPIGPSQQSIKSQKPATDTGNAVLFTRSPFKNRPPWSKFYSTPLAQPNFSKAPLDQSEHSKNSLPHPGSTLQNGSAKSSELSQRPKNATQQTPTTKSALTSATLAVTKNTSPNDSRLPGSASPILEGVLPNASVPKSNLITEKEPSLTPLPERPRNRHATSPTQPRSAFSPTSTPASQISVVINNSQRKANALLNRFIQPLPGVRAKERSTIEKNPAEDLEYRRRLLSELKKDVTVVRSRASSVEAVFGTHGLSARYSTDSDKVLRTQLAQPKAKKVRRKEVKLDWSSTNTRAQEHFEPEKLVPPKIQALEVLNSRFKDATGPPITFVNDINEKQLGGKFQFISSYIRRHGVEAAPPEAGNYGCDCIGSCKPDSCSCLVDDIEVDDFGDEIDHGKIIPYQRVRNAAGKPMSVLRQEYMKKSYADGERSEIVECNQNCGCRADCWNRVVQKGRTLPLEIFMTAKCGFGLRSPQDIIKGQFIDLYLGEVITETELESRELATDGAPSYIFSLDWFQLKDVYYVDSLNFGTPTRFLNHSCNPNCRVFTVILNHADNKVYGLAFFATRDIPAGTELNIDYNPQEAGKVYPKPKPGDDTGVVLCQCGSPDCRVRLWPGPKRKKGKGWARS